MTWVAVSAPNWMLVIWVTVMPVFVHVCDSNKDAIQVKYDYSFADNKICRDNEAKSVSDALTTSSRSQNHPVQLMWLIQHGI